MAHVAPQLLVFAPEQWGEAERFLKFYAHTHSFRAIEQRAASGVVAHLKKAQVLVGLANDLAPNLLFDQQEIAKNGFTPARNAGQIATVIEASILELYSALDCTAKVLHAIYGSTSRGFRNSTRGMFERASSIQGSFPEEIKEAISKAHWYLSLLYLRDELTHLSTGSVHKDWEGDLVRYMHFGIKQSEKPLVIEDIYGWLHSMLHDVNSFIGLVFHKLNATLRDEDVWQLCGFVQGRVLHRFVSPVGKLTFHSGRCGAWTWFEKEDAPSCPFVDVCGAYRNKAQPHQKVDQ